MVGRFQVITNIGKYIIGITTLFPVVLAAFVVTQNWVLGLFTVYLVFLFWDSLRHIRLYCDTLEIEIETCTKMTFYESPLRFWYIHLNILAWLFGYKYWLVNKKTIIISKRNPVRYEKYFYIRPGVFLT